MEEKKPFIPPPLPTGYAFDASINQTVPLYDPIDPQILEPLIQERTAVCDTCDKLQIKNDIRICGTCGCGLTRRIGMLYPFDENLKAYARVAKDGTLFYVCRLKKW